MSAEVRAFEHIAEGDHKCWLLKIGIVSFFCAMQTERVVDYEKATRSQFYWMSKDSEEFGRVEQGPQDVQRQKSYCWIAMGDRQ